MFPFAQIGVLLYHEHCQCATVYSFHDKVLIKLLAKNSVLIPALVLHDRIATMSIQWDVTYSNSIYHDSIASLSMIFRFTVIIIILWVTLLLVHGHM